MLGVLVSEKDLYGCVLRNKEYGKNKELVTKVACGEGSLVTWDQGRKFSLYIFLNVVRSTIYLISKYM